MKKFSRQEIDGTRAYFRNRNYEELDADIGGLTFSYFVIPRGVEPGLPFFVCRLTGEPRDGYVFGVSDQVEDDLRVYPVFHEAIEFFKIGYSKNGRCASALKRELELVPKNRLAHYVGMRRSFFSALAAHAVRHREAYTEDDILEFMRSLQILEDIQKQRPSH